MGAFGLVDEIDNIDRIEGKFAKLLGLCSVFCVWRLIDFDLNKLEDYN